VTGQNHARTGHHLPGITQPCPVSALLLAERDAVGVRASVVPSSSSTAPPQRLSRYDQTGPIWLFRGRPVVAFTTGRRLPSRTPPAPSPSTGDTSTQYLARLVTCITSTRQENVRHRFANAQWRMGLQMRIVSIALASVVAIGLLWSVAAMSKLVPVASAEMKSAAISPDRTAALQLR
jgi:hypothetical protein